MKKWWIYVMILCLIACTKEEKEPTPPLVGPLEIALKIKFPKSQSLYSRGLTTVEENRIETLQIFAFTNGGTDNQLDDKFAYKIDVYSGIQAIGEEIKQVNVALRMLEKRQRLVLVANPPAGISIEPTVGTTMRDIFTPIQFSASPWRTEEISDFPAFPMWGQMKDSILIMPDSNELPNTPIEINMFRTMAKVNIGVDTQNFSSTLSNDFKLETVYVCNASESSYLTPHSDYMSGSNINQLEIDKTRPTANKFAEQSYAVSSPYRRLDNTIYIPESDILSESNEPAFLVVKGSYKNKPGFYRIDFVRYTHFYPILRNHEYNINIIGVNTGGYSTLQEAKNAPPSEDSFSLIIDETNAVLNEFTYNNDYMLGVDISEVLFDWDKQLVSSVNNKILEQSIHLFTTYTQWSATIENGATWLTLVDGSTETSEISDKDQPSNTLSTFKIRMKEENLTGKERSAKITLKAGLLNIQINVRQSGGANAYLMRFEPGANKATIRIPLAYIREALRQTTQTIPDMSDLNAKVIWHEIKESFPVTFSATLSGTEYIEVTANATNGIYNGNALIALVKGTGIGMVGSGDPQKIVWSSHVWSMQNKGTDNLDYDFHNPNQERFMPTILGKHATNKGMFYQWGRKDPFPAYPNDVTPRVISTVPVSASNTLIDAIQHPTIFYSSHSDIHDWAGSLSNKDLWHTTQKTYYDPCPTGWRVPERNESNHYWHIPTEGNIFLNGFINGTTGEWKAKDSFHFGYLWTATASMLPDHTPVLCIDNTGNIDVTAYSSRVVGHSIRCIKDITLVKNK
ncbi:BACON domain-containing carbohydrate-binding protein [Parabacteroides sp. PF5-9]|uniref:BACON domain-containing protein n=1 Tax=Parabacteroides sp. PF5-9 TaxID=1742404 RepID=UPI0024758D7D|nr:BACON domain-containing carbohydrate-binding protein [Parabacteroides sp. PF5-9]MDH6357366.1 hypothetical protein [Parabacteroides sp. PF5-9]